MADKTVTFTAGAWVYPDYEGIPHTVTTSQTLTFNLVDTSATDVKYHLSAGQVVTTTDNYRLYMSPAQQHTYVGQMTDAAQGTAQLGPNLGDWVILDPKNHMNSRWRAVSVNVDDADTPTSITATFESVNDNMKRFTWTALAVA